MKHPLPLQLIASIIGGLFLLFIVSFGNRVEKGMQEAVEQHARVVSTSLWNLNQNSQSEYFTIVSKHYNYETISILDHDGKIFLTASAPTPNWHKTILLSLKLIPRVNLSAPIIYDGEKIGSVIAIWHRDTIYTYSYILIVVLLILTIFYFYNRLLKNNLLLEDKVAERTKVLQESERNYREIFNSTSDAIFIHDAVTGEIIDVNDSMLEMYGYIYQDALKLGINDLSSGESPYSEKEAINHIQKATEKRMQLFEWLARSKNSELFWVEVALKNTEIGGKGRVLAVVRDISARKKLEEELNQAQKMEAIGTLAGGIAHDFNNILSAIYGYSQLAEEDIANNPQNAKKDIEEVLKAADRARKLVKQILTFSRKTEHEKQPLQISLVVKEALKLLRSSIPTTIEIKQDISSDAVVLADPTKIHQITMNLCTNAYQAMRDIGGTLSVSLKEVNFSKDEIISQLEITPGKYLMMEVSDSGTGMDAETIKKIFEPYFTTKAAGEGTGLGLAVVHGIIQDHNGYINVYSEPNQGTSFHLYLPIIEEKALGFQVKEEKISIQGGSERVVVVDDEEQIINLTKRMLSRRGYKVTTFTNGVQALQEIKKHPDQFDLVITDLTMPYMTGIELAKEILAINPKLPIILNTGLSEALNKEKAMAAGVKAYCQKPLAANQLLSTIRKVLDTST